MESLIQSYQFNEREILVIKHRFIKISKNNKEGILTKNQFRNSIGILGLEHSTFLSDRIFELLDSRHDGNAKFEDFVKYMSVLVHGNSYQKAQQSFKMLDIGGKNKIVLHDIEMMVNGIC